LLIEKQRCHHRFSINNQQLKIDNQQPVESA